MRPLGFATVTRIVTTGFVLGRLGRPRSHWLAVAKGSVVTDLTGSHGASFAGVLAVRLGSWVVPARGPGAADSAGSCAARRGTAMARITLGGGQVKHRGRGMVVPCRWHGAWEAVVCTEVVVLRGYRSVRGERAKVE